MTTRKTGDDGMPDEPEDMPSIPDDVWLKFLTDNERAIRTSAPRELSARERAPNTLPGAVPAEAGGSVSEGRTRRPQGPPGAVGELWQPEENSTGPAWRDLDARARLRRAGRIVATAAAITLALGLWSWMSTSAGAPAAPLGETVQQSEQAPPTTLPLAPESTFASSSPSPAG